MTAGVWGSDTLVRVVTAAVVVPILVALIWIHWLDVALLVAAVLLAWQAGREYARLAGRLCPAAGGRLVPLLSGGTVLWTGIVLRSGLAGGDELPQLGVLTAVFLVLAGVRMASSDRDIVAFGLDFLGVVYTGGLFSYLVVLHNTDPCGPGLITFLLVVVAWSDTGAYFVGRKWGKHPMAPRLSPKKTWEGAVGGLAGAALSGVALAWLVRRLGWCASYPETCYLTWAALAVLLSIVSQWGDLFESMLKRAASVKDAGNVFPGHGGVLDRCDGILFAAPVLYYICLLMPEFMTSC